MPLLDVIRCEATTRALRSPSDCSAPPFALANGLVVFFCGWRGERGAPPRAAGDPTPGGGASTVGLFTATGPAALVSSLCSWKAVVAASFKIKEHARFL